MTDADRTALAALVAAAARLPLDRPDRVLAFVAGATAAGIRTPAVLQRVLTEAGIAAPSWQAAAAAGPDGVPDALAAAVAAALPALDDAVTLAATPRLDAAGRQRLTAARHALAALARRVADDGRAT